MLVGTLNDIGRGSRCGINTLTAKLDSIYQAKIRSNKNTSQNKEKKVIEEIRK